MFAVYMPPQAPTIGQAFFSMPSKSSSLILPAVNAPTASNARDDGEVLALPLAGLDGAARRRRSPGTFMRAIAIMPPGMFLSQPPTTSTPSIAWPLTAVSIASAITSRDTSEYFIASVPMPMPSVIGRHAEHLRHRAGLPAAPPSRGRPAAGCRRCTGFMVEWPLATPTIGFSKSPSPKPTARSIARLGERATPAVISLERRFCGRRAMVLPPREAASLRPRRAMLQSNTIASASVILYWVWNLPELRQLRYFVAVAERAALRPRRGRAAHLAAAAVARDPRAGGASSARALFTRTQRRRSSSRRRARASCEEARRMLAQLEHAALEVARHGRGRERPPAPGLRLARRLRRAARPAEGFKAARPGVALALARDALARAGGGARGRASSTSACCCRRWRTPTLEHLVVQREKFVAALPARHPAARGAGADRDARARRRAVRHGAARDRARACTISSPGLPRARASRRA